MQSSDLISIKSKINKEWAKVIFNKDNINLFLDPFMSIKDTNPDYLCPSFSNVLEAFNFFDPLNTKVVLIGQDPYPNMNEAHGLCFSTKNKKLSMSLNNIKDAIEYNYPDQVLVNGDLTHWAQQGVLMLNMQLTTLHGKSKAHCIWSNFTNFIIKWIDDNVPNVIFVLWGKEARSVSTTKTTLRWRHPSPLSNITCKPEEKFNVCTHFKQINDLLEEPIMWGHMNKIDYLKDIKHYSADQIRSHENISNSHIDDTLFIFTDGAAKANGKPKAAASYAFVVKHNQETIFSGSGMVEKHELWPPSNSRGELLGLIHALQYVYDNNKDKVMIYSDSQYCVNTYNSWITKWFEEDKLSDKKNIDLITKLYELKCNIKTYHKVIHCYGHMDEPKDTFDKFIWQGNFDADVLATKTLRG